MLHTRRKELEHEKANLKVFNRKHKELVSNLFLFYETIWKFAKQKTWENDLRYTCEHHTKESLVQEVVFIQESLIQESLVQEDVFKE